MAGPESRFRCNLCGKAEVAPDDAGRCAACGASVRTRSLIHVLSTELFGRSMVLPDFPVRPDIVGVGISDAFALAGPLACKFRYTNTYYHQEPLLDVTDPPQGWHGQCNFVVCSEILEHIPPPVSAGFRGLASLLKPRGVVVFTVPYVLADPTVEHFPDLYEFRIERPANGGPPVLHNRTRDGREQTFSDLKFHGGQGATLEMRLFARNPLLAEIHAAGLSAKVYDEAVPEFGIVFPKWSRPTALRLAAPPAPAQPRD